jgi:hypothetical protein
MSELIFIVEDAPEGGYTARARGESIFTEADDLDSLDDKSGRASTTSPFRATIRFASALSQYSAMSQHISI